MKLLVDTSVLIDHLRGRRAAVDLLLDAVTRGDELWAVVLSRSEVLRGMRAGEAPRTMRLLSSLSWLDVTPEIADRAGEIGRRYRRSHPGIDLVDLVIAAATEAMPARLLTLNVKHFPMLVDLEPPYR
ncbi:MAG TPA: type II toxin-antitoxin system VapC family toxin [Candidatus Limnocylindria bacterium]|jgi:predicted nucleic acid-binding protein|nr:type II toxin-antitoxin system VapC family toxin [Candidatus Limnocylindria bacterium]